MSTNNTETSDQSSATFSKQEWQRYARHIQLPTVGVSGQSKLKNSHVVIVGVGGLGAPVSQYLAAAGIGHITLIDNDTVSLSNLQRQVIFNSKDQGLNKVDAAKSHLLALNPHIHIDTIKQKFGPQLDLQSLSSIDLVMDCTDNLPTRYAMNDSCLAMGIPWIYASIYQHSGQCALFTPNGPCYRCLFPEADTSAVNCSTAGVLGVLPGMLGTIQANEALKYLCGLATPLDGQLLLIDTLELNIQKIRLSKQPNCLCCSNTLSKQATEQNNSVSTPPKLGDSNDHQNQGSSDIEPEDFANLQESSTLVIIDVRELAEREAFHCGGRHVPLSQFDHVIDTLKIELANTDKVICYCQSGIRSGTAAERLKAEGIDAISLRGGIAALLEG